jgi:hypothetical protein
MADETAFTVMDLPGPLIACEIAIQRKTIH